MAEDKKVVTKKTAKKKAAEADTTAPAAPVTKKTVARKAATKKTAAAAPAAPVTKKTIAKKAPAPKAPSKKAATKKAPAKAGPRPPLPDRAVTLKPISGVTAEERYKMIQEAAYYRAEKRGFAPGHEEEDWAAAAAEIDALLTDRGQSGNG